MSFQITVLKVLAGQPSGRASLADLKHAVAILISSGPDWTNRTKTLAARAPDLDIFSQSLVVTDAGAWKITDLGRTFLDSIEKAPIQGPVQSSIVDLRMQTSMAAAAPSPSTPVLPTSARQSRRQRRRRRVSQRGAWEAA